MVLHAQPLNGPSAFLPCTWPTPWDTFVLNCTYLFAMQSLHVDQGSPDLLESCLWLQRVVRGIKCSQDGLLSKPCQPVSRNIIGIINFTLHLNSFDYVMFSATCLLAYFVFLQSAEFNVPSISAFNPSLHLFMSDVSGDVLLDPSCLQVFIETSKMSPFEKGVTF